MKGEISITKRERCQGDKFCWRCDIICGDVMQSEMVLILDTKCDVISCGDHS